MLKKCNFHCFNCPLSAKISSASGGLRPWPGALPLDPTGATLPDPIYARATALAIPPTKKYWIRACLCLGHKFRLQIHQTHPSNTVKFRSNKPPSGSALCFLFFCLFFVIICFARLQVKWLDSWQTKSPVVAPNQKWFFRSSSTCVRRDFVVVAYCLRLTVGHTGTETTSGLNTPGWNTLGRGYPNLKQSKCIKKSRPIHWEPLRNTITWYEPLRRQTFKTTGPTSPDLALLVVWRLIMWYTPS